MAYKRKYRKGARIYSLDHLAEQEFIYFQDKITHAGWFLSWQFRATVNYMKLGMLYFAERVEE